MILKRTATIVMCIVGLIQGIQCASYSKVYVQSGANASPYPYYNYGAPAITYGPQLSRLSASPIGSVVPLPQAASFVPCVPAPCIPTQSIAPIANADLVAYKAPSPPVVVTKDEPASYEYSYVVYDENTGDQKTLKELSDGVVVRGQYSLLQPDGFNAVVRKFLPEAQVKTIEIKPAKDCNDKSAALKVEPRKETVTSSDRGNDQSTPAAEKATSQMELQEENVKEKPRKEAPAKEEKNAPPEPEKQSPVEVITAEVKEEKAPKPLQNQNQNTQEQSKETTSQKTKPVEPQRPPGHENETAEEHANHINIKAVQLPALPQGVVIENQPISYATYNQLMRCIQAMKNADQQRINSPLSYILLPSNALTC